MRVARIAKHSRLCSSSMFKVRNAFPSSVRWCMEVIQANVVVILRSQPDTCAVVQPEPAVMVLFQNAADPPFRDPDVIPEVIDTGVPT